MDWGLIEHLFSAFQREITHIREQQQRKALSRIVRAEQDEADLAKCYRRIGILLGQLEVSAYLIMSRLRV
jgi:hypothetical protein